MDKNFSSKVKKFVSEKVMPWTKESGNLGTYPKPIIDEMKKIGLFGMNIPVEWGGLGLKMAEVSKVIEELSFGLISLAAILGSHLRVCSYVNGFGTPDQKMKLLSKLAKGEIIAAHAWTEKTGKSANNFSTVLGKKNHDWAVSGEKLYVTNAAHADLFAVAARFSTGEASQTSLKTAVALMLKGAPGIYVDDIPRLGLNEVSLCVLRMENVKVDVPDDIIGGLNCDALQMAKSTISAGLINYTARAVGLGRAILEQCLRHAQSKPNGERPLSDIPLVRIRIAEIKMRVSVLSLMLDGLLGKLDSGQDIIADAYGCKTFAAETVVDLAKLGVKLHGGGGYTSLFPVERYLREAVALTLIGAPTDVALDRIAKIIFSEDAK